MPKKTSLATTLGTAAVALALGQPVAAVDESNFRFDKTSDLAAVCSVTADAAEYALANQSCRAFIEAAVQYHDEISNRKKMKRLVCYPASATIEDGKAVFVAWAAAHASNQKLMNEVPVIGLMRSLNAKFPCKG
jgi:hypothetical protein